MTVQPGTPYVFASPVAGQPLAVPLTITVIPGGGGSVTVETQTANGGSWVAVAAGLLAGALAATQTDVLLGPVFGLRFTAATTTATVEIAQ